MKLDFDLPTIGGGINDYGITRDTAGRALDVGLVEMNDLGWATSASSTKLFHGGLRYTPSHLPGTTSLDLRVNAENVVWRRSKP